MAFERKESGFYAVDSKTGKEIIYGEYGNIVIREALVSDAAHICKTQNVRNLIATVVQTSGMSRKVATAYIERDFQNVLGNRMDTFGNEYVIEIDGKFVGYLEITTYDSETYIANDGTEQEVVKHFVNSNSYDGECTFGGAQFFFLNKDYETKYADQVEQALIFLCREYCFFDHLDLVKMVVRAVTTPTEKKEVQQIKIIRNLYDFWGD